MLVRSSSLCLTVAALTLLSTLARSDTAAQAAATARSTLLNDATDPASAHKASILQLPVLTINIPAEHRLQDTVFRRVERSIFVVDDAGTAQGPAAALIKLSDMHALFPAPQSYVHSGRATPLLAFRAQCGANRTKELHLNVCLDDVEHALRFVLDADALNRRVLVLLQKNDSVEEVAHRAAVFLGLDGLQERWLAATLAFGRRRHQLPVYARQPLRFRFFGQHACAATGLDAAQRSCSGDNVPVEIQRDVIIREGDDLHSLLEFSALQFGFPWRVKDALLEVLQNSAIPWGSASWLKSSCQRFPLFNDTLTQLLSAYGLPRSTVAASSTLGRLLPRFQSDADRVLCHITVVDDGSSKSERNQMLERFGDVVEFVFRPHGAGAATVGHASSMNLLLSLAASRGAEYFLYLEDDWSLVSTETTDASLSRKPSNFQVVKPIAAAMMILGKVNNPSASSATEPLVQVHLNSQSAKACAYQDRSVLSDAECAQIVASQTSGWPRVVSFGNTTIGYRLHEWGRPTKQPLQFSSWPGFTFNPSVWDLRYLQNLLGIPVASHFAANGNTTSVWFDTQNPAFERHFSLKVASAGLRVAYLDQLTFRHTGVGNFTSAYTLTKRHRPWDR
eukprot:INCI6196.1.p1 GENE.INCI6196.1~~INCI6196.1.p1  ORF type:complete len:620 (-),score=82.47 INCI6196.1:2401-4260(-)